MGWFVVTLLKVWAELYRKLPTNLRLRLGRALGNLLRLLSVRVEVVRANLIQVFPGNTKEMQELRNTLFLKSYLHLGNLILESLMIFGRLSRFVLKHSEIRGTEYLKAAHAKGKGVILVSSHLGNWEVMTAASGTLGIDLMMVTKHLKPEWLHRAVELGRLRCGVRATYEPKTLREVLKTLRSGGTIGIVLDQYAGPPIGVRVPFFGVPVGTNGAVAAFARRTGAAVVPVSNWRNDRGDFMIEIEPEIPWEAVQCAQDAKTEIALNTARYVEALEMAIRKHPEQWLWIHRRFKGDLGPLLKTEWQVGRVRSESAERARHKS